MVPWYWFENAVLLGQGQRHLFRPKHPGSYQILVVDQSGAMDRISVEVF
jgi:membrane carboxypeptidase/penicillin-binding protein PbpC